MQTVVGVFKRGVATVAILHPSLEPRIARCWAPIRKHDFVTCSLAIAISRQAGEFYFLHERPFNILHKLKSIEGHFCNDCHGS